MVSKYPLIFPPQRIQRLVRRALRAEAIRVHVEVRLVDRRQHHRDGLLQDLVREGRDPERPELPVRLRDVDPSDGRRPVALLSSSSSCPRFPSRSRAKSAAVCPSMPTAPPFRVRRYASRRKSMSMWWASVVRAAIVLESSAIRWSRGVMSTGPGVRARGVRNC